MRTPILNRSGYVLDSQELRVLQQEGWVVLPLAEIAEVKRPSFATAVVRLSNGRRKNLVLSHLNAKGFSEVVDVLNKAVHDRRVLTSKRK